MDTVEARRATKILRRSRAVNSPGSPQLPSAGTRQPEPLHITHIRRYSDIQCYISSALSARPQSQQASPNFAYHFLISSFHFASQPLDPSLQATDVSLAGSARTLGLMGANDAPSAIEASRIRELLEQEEKEISECGDRLRYLQEETNRLAAHRRAVLETARGHRAQLSAFRRFPPELLSEIFIHCLNDDEHHLPAESAPLILCWVSQKWRHIAMSTPALWTSPRSSCNPKKSLRLAELWLTHSRSLPLNLHVRCGVSVEPGDDMTLLDACVLHAHRWKHVDIVCFNDALEGSVIALPDAVAPGLESANIHFYPSIASGIEWTLKLLRSATVLRSITWGATMDPLFTQVSLANLTSFCVDTVYTPARQLFRLFAHAPQLRDCTMTVGVEEDGAILRDAVGITHPNLEALDLTAYDPEYYLGVLLDQMTLPALKKVHLHGMGGTWPEVEFHTLLTRSSCAMTSLSLAFFDIIEEEVIAILEHKSVATSLVHLNVQYLLGPPPLCTPDAVLQFLASPTAEDDASSAAQSHPPKPCALPKLEKIGINVEPSSQSTLFEQIIKSRSPSATAYANGAVATLKEVNLVVVRPHMLDVYVEDTKLENILEDIKAAGVVVERSRYTCGGGPDDEPINLRSLYMT